MAKTCQICGKPSGMYPLCPACFKLRDAGEIIKCEECKTWHKKDQPCQCAQEPINIEITTKEEKPEIVNLNELHCLVCENPSGTFLFCKTCYHKYKNKSLHFKVTNCEKFELLDDYYEGSFSCEDGHIVKSKSERAIDDYLYHNNIKHAYEYKVVKDIEKKEYIHPDFYLPEMDAYIEHWGYGEENKSYTEQKEYKLDFYRSRKMTIICTHESSDMKDIYSILQYKLNNFEKGKINFEKP